MDQVKDRALGQVRHKDRALAVLEIPHGSSQGPGPWAKVGHKGRALAGLEFFPAVRPQRTAGKNSSDTSEGGLPGNQEPSDSIHVLGGFLSFLSVSAKCSTGTWMIQVCVSICKVFALLKCQWNVCMEEMYQVTACSTHKPKRAGRQSQHSQCTCTFRCRFSYLCQSRWELAGEAKARAKTRTRTKEGAATGPLVETGPLVVTSALELRSASGRRPGTTWSMLCLQR